MTFNSDIHRRRSIRLQGYDYSQAGAYFITICTQKRECLFGEILDGEMRLNDAGKMIRIVWDALPVRFPNVELDEFVIMPNHIHGIVVLTRRGEPCVRPESCIRPIWMRPGITDDYTTGDHKDRPYGTTRDHRPVEQITDEHTPQGEYTTGEYKIRPYGYGTLPDTIGRIFQAFKSITTHEYTTGVKQNGWPIFPGKLWQRNYWEHIIRNEMELNRIREYIRTNPTQWEFDRLNVGEGDAVRPTVIHEPVFNDPKEGWMV